MYRSGPPQAAGGLRTGLRVRRVASQVFDGTSETSLDPDLRVYLADMIRPYELALREDLLAERAGHNYGEMAEELLRATVSEDEPIDLLLLAFGIPDVRPGRCSALYLSSVCPGEPLAFAICEQGTGAAHTALKLARDYGRGGGNSGSGCQRALVLIVEQAALHYEPAPSPTAPLLPDRHTAVALVCDQSGTDESVLLRQHTDVAPESISSLLLADIAMLTVDHARTVVILGAGLAAMAQEVKATGCDDVVVACAGQPYTGMWSELAGGLPQWTAEGALILLADYDSQLRYLSVCGIDTVSAP